MALYYENNIKWSRSDLIAAFFASEIGDVEFTELMLEDGASMEQIGECLQEAQDDLRDDE